MLTNPLSPLPPTGAAPGADDPAQLAELLVRATRRLQRSSMAELGPIGLTGAKARVIRYLSGAGHPARMADIAAALEVVPRSATSLVDDLEEAGLVKRAVDPADRRSILVSLTRQGLLLLDRVAQARGRTAEVTFSPLSMTERAELRRLLSLCCGPCCGPEDHGGPTRAYRPRASGTGGS
ncbi:MAG: MarR family transcriptional regulator [Acidimicrobiales bacterium]|jgi:DNA-binding MarR family transcriptional regulator